MNDNVTGSDTTSAESATEFIADPKRKSSIFSRKSSVAFLNKEDLCGRPSDNTAVSSQVDIDAYVEILKNEISDWEVMYKQRRDTRKKATKQFRTRLIVNEDLLGILTEEDNEFLAGRPDYYRTGRDAISAQARLQVSVEHATDMGNRLSNLIERFQVVGSGTKKRIVESFIQ